MRVGPYKVKWEHNIIEGMQTNSICTIVDTSFVEPQIVGIGCCYLHPKDHFCKNVGRKISLARALHNWGITKVMKQQVWLAYYEMRGGKW